MINGIEIIAEVKIQSPFGFKSRKSWEELFELAERVGDMISIHTDPRWGGSFELLKKARAKSKKPILAKGIHATDDEVRKAIDAGADFVLVVGRVPSCDDSSPIRIGRLPKIHLDKCLIEPLTLAELSALPSCDDSSPIGIGRLPKTVLKVVWNSRDLKTGGLKSETFEEARKIWKGWLCQASNIKTIADIKSGADAVLVGENLEAFSQSLHQ